MICYSKGISAKEFEANLFAVPATATKHGIWVNPKAAEIAVNTRMQTRPIIASIRINTLKSMALTSVFIKFKKEAAAMNEEIKKTGAIVLSDEETEKVSGGTDVKIHYANIYCPHCNKGAYYPDNAPMMGIFCKFCNYFFYWQRP